MAKPKRNYKAEYQARIARGLREGLTRTQARGHPRAGERFASFEGPAKPAFDRRLELGVRRMREGRSLSGAARAEHVSPEGLRRYATDMGLVEHRGKRLVIADDDRTREVVTYSRGRRRTIRIKGFAQSAKWGGYMAAVGVFLSSNNPKELLPFENDGLVDTQGVFHPFEVRPNMLYRLALDPFESFEQIYRIVV